MVFYIYINIYIHTQILGCNSEHKNIFLPSKSFQPIMYFFNVLDIRATKKNNIWLPPSSCPPKYGNDEEPGPKKSEIVHVWLNYSYPSKVRTSCPKHMSLLPLLLNFSSLGINTSIPMGKVRNH